MERLAEMVLSLEARLTSQERSPMGGLTSAPDGDVTRIHTLETHREPPMAVHETKEIYIDRKHKVKSQ